MSYPPNIRNQICRAYLLRVPCQPRHYKFPQKVDRTRKRRFIASWFDEFGSWLEYSIEKDAAYCLYCHLFATRHSERGHDAFVSEGLAFRGNDELENSLNQGNFLELLKVLASCNEEINNVMLKNAPNNLKLTSPHIQTDIINSATTEITKAIITYLRDDLFSILVDECRDVSIKEQMGVVIWYVNGFGCVIERFISLVHIQNTSATSLKKGIESLLSTYGLNISSLRGQGYDGATNMRGICFKKSKKKKVFEEIAKCEIKTEQGLNQEMALKRSGDTRWSSHYGTVVNLMHLFPSVIDVLEYIGENGSDDPQRAEAIDLLDIMN
ncbi:uncharacterized protein LOC110655698 [Hevea brasiliensis]|uniref:uncharacterized protein LOC110655698 n=1 Tax=Hevea brasiliensis TaxID=3981 RepID=UPI0025F02750|nr:uncharacterized protein LOC110655698 [Hevea brasiliensis]